MKEGEQQPQVLLSTYLFTEVYLCTYNNWLFIHVYNFSNFTTTVLGIVRVEPLILKLHTHTHARTHARTHTHTHTHTQTNTGTLHSWYHSWSYIERFGTHTFGVLGYHLLYYQKSTTGKANNSTSINKMTLY